MVSAPLLFGGASSQPDHLVPPGYVKTAVNACFSPVDGIFRRPPTWIIAELCFDEAAGLFPAANNRLHSIVIGLTDVYLVVHNRTSTAGYLRVFKPDTGEWAEVTISSDAQTYLNIFASPDAFVFRPVEDSTFIINRDRIVEGDNSAGTIDEKTMPVRMRRRSTGSTGTITANTDANPTVVTSAGHGLVNGQPITITGSNSTPSIDGDHIVSDVTTDTFTVPVDVSGGTPGTEGTWTAPLWFDVDTVDWAPRDNRGDADTNPLPSIFDGEHQIRDLIFHRGRLCLVGGSRFVASQAAIPLDFFIEDPTSVTDADPIDVPVASGDASEEIRIDYLVPIRRSLLMFANAGRQFELTSTELLTPSTVKILPFARYKTLPVRPEVMDPLVFFVSQVGCNAQVWQYTFDEVNLPSSADDVTEHVHDLINLQEFDADEGWQRSTIRAIAASAETQTVLFMRRDRDANINRSKTIFAYRCWFQPDGSQFQRAWARWDFEGLGATGAIHDITVVGDTLYMLVHARVDASWRFFLAKCLLPGEGHCDEPPTPVACPEDGGEGTGELDGGE